MLTIGVTGHVDGIARTSSIGSTKSRSTTTKATKASINGQSSAVLDRCIPQDVDCELTPKTRVFVLNLFDRIEELTKRLEKLEARPTTRLTTQNSSLPPSNVHPHGKPKSKKPKSQRKQGGQPGNKRHTRPLIPTEQYDQGSIATLCQQTKGSK